MEWKFTFRDDGILEIKAGGLFTFDDFRTMATQMISDSKWKPGLSRLFDSREVDLINLDRNTMYNIGKVQQGFTKDIGEGKLAILVKNTADYGAGITYKDFVDEDIGSKVKIFINYDKAIEWLTCP